jgi:hypothetical protein
MAPTSAPWKAIEFAFVFAMWAVMMVGMMAPSAAPMILMYARVGRQGKAAGKPLAATGWFAAGYFLAWIGFSLAATLVQWAVERAALLDSRMASASNLFGGIVLIAAGVYQWTPLKDVCLVQCQTPLQFLMRHGGFRGDVPGCLLLGLRHGAYCVGCCWFLMALSAGQLCRRDTSSFQTCAAAPSRFCRDWHLTPERGSAGSFGKDAAECGGGDRKGRSALAWRFLRCAFRSQLLSPTSIPKTSADRRGIPIH